jgi:hypothetical protein
LEKFGSKEKSYSSSSNLAYKKNWLQEEKNKLKLKRKRKRNGRENNKK